MKIERKMKTLTPAQERRKQFIMVFFASNTVKIGFAVIVIMVLSAVFAPLAAPYSPYKQDLRNMLKGMTLLWAEIFCPE